jgi:hypothetical protein
MTKYPEYDLSTVCLACGYKIHPSELQRTGWSKILCPCCKQEFTEPEHPKGRSTS